MEINKKTDLGKVLSGDPEKAKVSKDEEIGFHKGALNTLMSERNELIKIIANVEAIMQAHLSRLKELGITLQVQKQKE